MAAGWWPWLYGMAVTGRRKMTGMGGFRVWLLAGGLG